MVPTISKFNFAVTPSSLHSFSQSRSHLRQMVPPARYQSPRVCTLSRCSHSDFFLSDLLNSLSSDLLSPDFLFSNLLDSLFSDLLSSDLVSSAFLFSDLLDLLFSNLLSSDFFFSELLDLLFSYLLSSDFFFHGLA